MAEQKNDCPKCGGETTFGYGLAGGGGPSDYRVCLDCDWFEKPLSDESVSCLHQLGGKTQEELEDGAA